MGHVRSHHIARSMAVAFLTLLIVLATACSRVGDHSYEVDSIQGEWQVVGTRMTVVVTGNQILLPEDTVYDYTIDTVDGTISFSVGEVAGEARYTLGTDSTSGLLELELVEDVDGSEVSTVFVKLSDDTAAVPTLDGGRDEFADPGPQTM